MKKNQQQKQKGHYDHKKEDIVENKYSRQNGREEKTSHKDTKMPSEQTSLKTKKKGKN